MRHRDASAFDTAGLSPLMAAAAKVMPDQDAQTADRLLARYDARCADESGRRLGSSSCSTGSRWSAIAAGRAWQRLHLAPPRWGLPRNR